MRFHFYSFKKALWQGRNSSKFSENSCFIILFFQRSSIVTAKQLQIFGKFMFFRLFFSKKLCYKRETTQHFQQKSCFFVFIFSKKLYCQRETAPNFHKLHVFLFLFFQKSSFVSAKQLQNFRKFMFYHFYFFKKPLL